MRATEHASRDPFHVLERLHGLAEVGFQSPYLYRRAGAVVRVVGKWRYNSASYI